MPRFLRFNSVGALGFALQLGLLALLLRLGLHYLAATALAVELTVLHNFVWHERWTWRDRPTRSGVPSTKLRAGRAQRLWRFHAANGLISLAGNLLLMRVMVGLLGLPAVPANLLAVLLCSLVNFTASDRFVFRVT
jgi:putative flippase GtrA